MSLAGFVALNLLLFVPLYLLNADENDFWPFFPLGHPRGAYDWGWSGLGRSTYEYAMQLFVRRFNKDIFRDQRRLGLPLLVVDPRRPPAPETGGDRPSVPLAGPCLRRAAGRSWRTAASSTISSTGPARFFDDVLMLESAWIFVRDTWGLAELLYVVAGLAAVAGLGMLAARCLDTAWRWGAGLDRRRAIAGWAVVNALLHALALVVRHRHGTIRSFSFRRSTCTTTGSGRTTCWPPSRPSTTLSWRGRSTSPRTTPVRRPDLFSLRGRIVRRRAVGR